MKRRKSTAELRIVSLLGLHSDRASERRTAPLEQAESPPGVKTWEPGLCLATQSPVIQEELLLEANCELHGRESLVLGSDAEYAQFKRELPNLVVDNYTPSPGGCPDEDTGDENEYTLSSNSSRLASRRLVLSVAVLDAHEHLCSDLDADSSRPAAEDTVANLSIGKFLPETVEANLPPESIEANLCREGLLERNRAKTTVD